ncbi:MAG: transcription antitermination factor NusB [Nitrospira sp.]|nr:transcription antitermination factor NusB [Nitrospira sp.]
MKRRRAREYALQLLFQIELIGRELDMPMWNEFWENNKAEDDVMQFAHGLIKNTRANLPAIDEFITAAADNWDLDRMAVIDRTILRLAAYELKYRPDIPASVSINEALEIAKKYSTMESASFINGILDRIVNEGKPKSKKTKKAK